VKLAYRKVLRLVVRRVGQMADDWELQSAGMRADA
jgi:hypothetical protein